MSNEDKPIVFICHAFADKERFANKFSNRLKNDGIEVWYDDFEIKGENLISKINEGLKNANKGIIIYSKNIKNAKGALAEIDALTHKKIYEDFTLYLVKIDKNVEIAELLKPISYTSINNLQDYENEYNQILDFIFDKNKIEITEKQPNYFNIPQIPNCSKQDSEIFKSIGDYCMDEGFDTELMPSTILYLSDFSEDEIIDSIEFLEHLNYIKNEGSHEGMGFLSKSFTSEGFCIYFKNYVPSNKEIYKKVIFSIYQEKLYVAKLISNKENIDLNIVNALFELFEEKKFVELNSKGEIINISPIGDRYFNNILL